MKQPTKAKNPQAMRLGELIEHLGLLTREELREALQVSQETGLPVGRILVMSGYIQDRMLNSVIEAQSMLREGLVDLDTIRAALDKMATSQLNLKQALEGGGFKLEEKRNYLLGDLLLDAGFIKKNEFDTAMVQANATGLPLGRTLVLCGLIPEELLAKAINAQVLLRDEKVTREQVIQSLRTAASRHQPIEVPLAEKGYYALPARQSLRLGEILLAAGVLSESELMTALELGLSNNKPVGQVLVDLRFIDEPVIIAALDLQKRVVEQTIKLEEATRLLSSIHRDGISLEAALETLKNPVPGVTDIAPTRPSQAATGPTFPEYLQLTKNISQEELQKALEAVLANPALVAKVLEAAGAIDNNVLNEALRSYQLFRQGRLSLEHACIVLDFCKRHEVSTDEALKALNWQQPDQQKPSPSERQKKVADWAENCKTAYAIYELGDLDEAEAQWTELIKQARDLEIHDLRLPRAIEVLAKIYETQSKLDQALELATQGLKIKKVLFAPNHFETAATLNYVASLAYRLQDYKLSEVHSRQYLKILEVLSGKDHPNVASALDNLALCCHLQNRFEEAAELYQRALMICKVALGENHPTTIRVLRKYAATLRALKRDAEAAHLDNRAMGVISGSWKTISLSTQESLF